MIAAPLDIAARSIEPASVAISTLAARVLVAAFARSFSPVKNRLASSFIS